MDDQLCECFMHACFLSQDPKKSNGKILGYDVMISTTEHHEKSVLHSKEHKFSLNGGYALIIITANNSVGVSPAASLNITKQSMLTFILFIINCLINRDKLFLLLLYYVGLDHKRRK